MTAAELRALTAAGPAVVTVARDDMLALLDRAEGRQTPPAEALGAAASALDFLAAELDELGGSEADLNLAARLRQVCEWLRGRPWLTAPP